MDTLNEEIVRIQAQGESSLLCHRITQTTKGCSSRSSIHKMLVIPYPIFCLLPEKVNTMEKENEIQSANEVKVL